VTRYWVFLTDCIVLSTSAEIRD